jgi:histidyl-tRNA synthetase
LRAAGVAVQMHAAGADGWGSMKSQFKKADASGARYALIFGESEVSQGAVAVKPLRAEAGAIAEQTLLPLDQAAEWGTRLL